MNKKIFAFILVGLMLAAVGAVQAQDPVVTIKDISITPSTISPDEDGVDDRAIITFTVEKTLSQPWEHIEASVIIDADKDTEFEPPNWEEIDWVTTFPDDVIRSHHRPLNVDPQTQTGTATFKFEWDGRDNRWQVLPNDEYKVAVAVIQWSWNEQDQKDEHEVVASAEVDASQNALLISVATAGISGTVTDKTDEPIAGAHVSAGNPTSWGDAWTNEVGEYVISGLAPAEQGEQGYHVSIDAEGFVNTDYQKLIGDVLQSVQIFVDAGTITNDIDFSLQPALSIQGVINLVAADGTTPQPFVPRQSRWGDWYEHDLNINVNAWSPRGGRGTWGNAHIHGIGETVEQSSWVWNDQNADSDNDGRDDTTYHAHDDATFWAANEPEDYENDFMTVFSLDIEPGRYVVKAESQGYSSVQMILEVDEDGVLYDSDEQVIDDLVINLQKAGSVMAKLAVPEEIDAQNGTWKWVEFSAQSSDNKQFAWGGGQFDPESYDETNTYGMAEINSILEGTYTFKIKVDGYKPEKIEDVVVAQGQTVYLYDGGTTTEKGTFDAGGPIILNAGSTIAGTITLDDLDAEGPLSVNVNVWSHETRVHGWTQVTLNDGNSYEADYTVGGLEPGNYEMDIWFEGQYDVDPSRHRFVTAPSADIDFTLVPFSGKIFGEITGNGVVYEQVLVTAKDPHRWDAPIIGVTVESDGSYEVSGLGTGEFVVTVNEYTSESIAEWFEYQQRRRGSSGNGTVVPVGVDPLEDPPDPPVDQSRGPAFLKPTGNFGGIVARIPLKNGEELERDFELTAGYSVFGTFDVDEDYDGEYELEDFEGELVFAIPLKMRFMGMGIDAYQAGEIVYNEQTDEYEYEITGLGQGAYIIKPPSEVAGETVELGEGSGDNVGGFDQDQEDPDIAIEPQMAFLVGENTEVEINFTFTDGYDVSGTVTLPGKVNLDLKTFGDEYSQLADPAEQEELLDGYWIGEINIYQPDQPEGGSYRHMSLFAGDFYDEDSGQFKKTAEYAIEHLKNGKYVVEVHTPKYMTMAREVEIDGADVANVDFQVSKGASIVGRLVNAETGEAITGGDEGDGVWVQCEARPWKPGSWRSTNERWGPSPDTRIDGEEALTDKNPDGSDNTDTNPGNFYLTNLPAGNYVVRVRAEHGEKSGGAKNYASVTYGGVIVPEGSDVTVDMGPIQLVEGITISGNVTGMDPDFPDDPIPLGNIRLVAHPADRGSSAGGVEAVTDGDGNYVFYGIDPRVEFYNIIAAERPDWFEFVEVPWAVKERFNVEPGDTDVDFVLDYANAWLTGTIEKDDPDTPFKLPFVDAEEFPAALVLLQRVARFYEPMEGIEALTEPSDGDTASFTVRGLVPGAYRVLVFNYGLVTAETVVDIVAGENTLDDPIVLEEGGSVSGEVRKMDGTKFTLNDMTMVVAMPEDMSKLIFGAVVANPSTREVDTYLVRGLKYGETYKIMFIQTGDDEDGPEKIFPTTEPVIVTEQAPDATQHYTIAPKVADFLASSYLNDNETPANPEDDFFEISVFSSTLMSETDPADVIGITTEGDLDGEVGILSELEMGTDKMVISAIYTPHEFDTAFSIQATSYDTEGNRFSRVFTYRTNFKAHNQEEINPVMGGSVNVGNGDSTEAEFPQGAIDDVDGDGEAEAEIAALADEEAGGTAQKVRLLNGSSINTVVAERGATALSNVYELGLIGDDDLADDGTISLAVEFDTEAVGDGLVPTTDIDMFFFNPELGDSGEWEKIITDRAVVDEEGNHKLTITAAELGQYAIYKSKNLDIADIVANIQNDEDYQLDFDSLDIALTIPGDVLSALATMPEVVEKIESQLSAAIGNYETLADSNITQASDIVDIDLTLPGGESVTVRIPINPAQLAETGLVLFHFNETTGEWEEVAGSGKVGDYIQGEATSFSAFVGGKSAGGAAAPTTSTSGGSKCFIATATFGTSMASEVLSLCRFRDTVLRSFAPGRLFIKVYETVSPPVARFIERHELLKSLVRFSLRPVVWLADFALKAGLLARMLSAFMALGLGVGLIVLKRRFLA